MNTILTEKIINIIVRIYETYRKRNLYIQELCNAAGTSYSHTHKLIKLLEKKGLIKTERNNKRERKIILTSKGEKLAFHLKKALELWGGTDE